MSRTAAVLDATAARPRARRNASDPVAPIVNPELEEMKLRDRMAAVVGRLQDEVKSRIDKRRPIEDRMIADLEQYHGRYDSKTASKLEDGSKSKLFINLTMPKTNAMAARLMDLLFPTDDKNWGMGPTPVPMLNDDASKAVKALRAIEAQLKEMQEQQAAQAAPVDQNAPADAAPPAPPPPEDPELKRLQEEADVVRLKAAALQQIIEEARHRSDSMAREIEDQLTESLYHAAMRDVIDDGCKLGTGVIKGPVTGDRVRKGWKRPVETDDSGNPVLDERGRPVRGPFALDVADETQTPAMRWVDVWNFFPDMDVRDIKDGEGAFERHLLNSRGLRKLAALPGFDKDAIRRLLMKKPNNTSPDYLVQLRDLTDSSVSVSKSTYHVYEYSGPLSAEDVRDIALVKDDVDALAEVADLDPLTEVNAIVWFCDGEILKIAPYPFDSGETLYSVFNLIKDEATVFGYGIPHIISHPQKAVNAGWRMMMDNGGLSSGPQIVMAKGLIEPENDVWEITGRKIWVARDGIPLDKRVFDVFNIPSNQAEMANIIAIAKQFIDDMTGMPAVAQGTDGATRPERTAQGTALLMNASNVTFRRIVKSFDDDITVPVIRRLYDWNMQFNPKDEIKGDYSVDARGSSVLLVREMQAQNLMVIVLQLGAHPIYGPMLKNRELLRKLFQAHLIPGDEVLLTDEEIEATIAAAQKPAEDPALLQIKQDHEARMAELAFKESELAGKLQVANLEAGTRQKVAELNHQTAMMTLAEKMNMNADQLEAMLEKTRQELDSKERIFAAETAITERIGPSGGGMF